MRPHRAAADAYLAEVVRKYEKTAPKLASTAAISGAYGLAVVVDDYRAVKVQDDTPENLTQYQARFYLDPHDLYLNGANHTPGHNTNDRSDRCIASARS